MGINAFKVALINGLKGSKLRNYAQRNIQILERTHLALENINLIRKTRLKILIMLMLADKPDLTPN